MGFNLDEYEEQWWTGLNKIHIIIDTILPQSFMLVAFLLLIF